MVLPALFAACTNDDFQSAAPEAPVNAEGRNLVENVTLDLGGADTRLAYDGEYTWEAGDQIGACLMDVITTNYNTPNAIWRDRFDLVDYIQTNYRFTRDDAGLWNTEAKMLEGNYFFAYPYDANNGVRNAYKFSAAKQTLDGTATADLQKAYSENNSFVGYGKVEQGATEGETVKVDMLNVFGATGITIENGSGQESYTIERIVLRGTKVMNTATVDPTSCERSTQYATQVSTPANASEFNVAQYTKDADDLYHATFNTAGEYVSTWSSYDANKALRDVLDYTAEGTRPIEVVIDGGTTIGPRGTVNVLAMVAPEELDAYASATSNQAVLDIYTDKGIIRGIDLNRWYKVNDNTVSNPAEEASNILTDKALSGLGNGEKVKVTFDITSLDRPAEMDIYNNADLVNLIHWNASTAKEIKATLKSSNVQLTKAMFDELTGSQITKLTIKGSYTFTINKDVADGALNKISYDVNEVRVNGTQSLASNIGSNVRIQSGATVNVTKNITLNKTINNLGTLNVNAKVSGSGTINNGFTMSVASGKEIVKGVTVKNDFNNLSGTITNAGTIRNLNNTMLASTWGYVINTGIIGTEAQVAALANEPSKNAGIIENNNGRVFLSENTYNVYANGTSTTRINNNGSDADATKNGNIIITDLDVNQGNFLTENTKLGNIVQQITAPTNTDGVDGRANTLWLTSTLNVEKTDKDGNYVDVDLTSPSENAPALMNGDMKVIALTADAEIAGKAFQNFRMGSIIIYPKAKLRLNNVRMTVTKNTNVTMLGYASNVATFTINSNAALLVEGSANTTIEVQHPNSNTASHNVLDNNSNSTNIKLQ